MRPPSKLKRALVPLVGVNPAEDQHPLVPMDFEGSSLKVPPASIFLTHNA